MVKTQHDLLSIFMLSTDCRQFFLFIYLFRTKTKNSNKAKSVQGQTILKCYTKVETFYESEKA